MNKEAMKLRIQYLVIFLILLMVEIFIALYVRDRIIRPYVGDILVVVLLYFAVRIVVPEGFRWLPAGVFLFAAGIEILQYIQIVKVLGLEYNRILRTMIGTTFDLKDMWCYAVGGVVCGILQFTGQIIRKQRKVKKKDVIQYTLLILLMPVLLIGINCWTWLGSPRPSRILVNLSDSYPGHSISCLRSEVVYPQFETLFPDEVSSLIELYGEPVSEVLEKQNAHGQQYLYGYPSLAVVYWHNNNGKSIFQGAYIYKKDIRLPLTGIRVGDSKTDVEKAYRHHELVYDEETGLSGYLEPVCMMCNASKRYQIYFEYEKGYKDDYVSKIQIACPGW